LRFYFTHHTLFICFLFHIGKKIKKNKFDI
jgi:hypothetical protein